MVVRISDKTQNYSKVTKLLVKPKYIPQKNEMTKLYMSLIIAMLAGRIVNGLVNTCILSTQGYTLSVFMSASFITCLPGIVIQLIVIPVLVRILNKRIPA